MQKQLKIDFYKVTGPANFAAALRAVWALPNPDARTFVFADGPVRIRAHSSKDGMICGDMVRIRLGEPAFLAKLQGGERPITQDEDEGLGETNAFAYCPTTKYLAYQRNRSGVSSSRMAYYLNQKHGNSSAFLFEPVLSQVVVNQLINKAAPKRLRMKVTAASISADSTSNNALSEIIAAARIMESPEMEISFSVGRRRKAGMSKEGVISMVKSLLKLREAGHQVQALEVAAPAEAGHRAELYDFIDATLVSNQLVEASPLIEEFFTRRLACVLAAWDAHRSELG